MLAKWQHLWDVLQRLNSVQCGLQSTKVGKGSSYRKHFLVFPSLNKQGWGTMCYLHELLRTLSWEVLSTEQKIPWGLRPSARTRCTDKSSLIHNAHVSAHPQMTTVESHFEGVKNFSHVPVTFCGFWFISYIIFSQIPAAPSVSKDRSGSQD